MSNYIIEEKYKNIVEAIKANTKEADRKAIVKAIVVACMTGTAQPVLLKENLIRKTRSKKYPITTTDYGEAWLRTTDAGLTFVHLADK